MGLNDILFPKKKKLRMVPRRGAGTTLSGDYDDYVGEFREGISELRKMFNTDGNMSEKFAQLSIGLANFSQYRNSVYDDMLSDGIPKSEIDSDLRAIIIEAGSHEMIDDIVAFRESPKRRKRNSKEIKE